MQMMIGPVRLSVSPVPAVDYTRKTTADYATKAVLGAREPLEFVGNGAETWTVNAKLYPHRFGGGGMALNLLSVMRSNGIPQIVVRGDGSIFGWFVIESVSETGRFLDARGVGRVIEVSIGLRRASSPGVGGVIAAIAALF